MFLNDNSGRHPGQVKAMNGVPGLFGMYRITDFIGRYRLEEFIRSTKWRLPF